MKELFGVMSALSIAGGILILELCVIKPIARNRVTKASSTISGLLLFSG